MRCDRAWLASVRSHSVPKIMQMANTCITGPGCSGIMENEFAQVADTHGHQINQSLDQLELCHATYLHYIFPSHAWPCSQFFTRNVNDRRCNMSYNCILSWITSLFCISYTKYIKCDILTTIIIVAYPETRYLDQTYAY